MECNVYRCSLVKDFALDVYGEVNTPTGISAILKNLGVSDSPDEFFYVFCFDVKLKIVGIHEISHGSCSGAPVHPREVFKRICLNNASAFIMAHNHPSGVVTPSEDDVETTKKLIECGKLMGIKALDHLIVSGDDFYSFKENNVLF